MSRYIVGQGKAPEWAAKRMMCFQRLDGGVGWEIETGRNNTKRLYEGDIIVDKGDFVQVLRNSRSEGAKDNPFTASGPPSLSGTEKEVFD